MGAGVSDWRLARAVATRGQVGVVSGTALDLILVRWLEMGDPGGHMRRALAAFPEQGVAQRILGRYYVAEGKSPEAPYRGKPMVGHRPGREIEELLMAGNFAQVFLAKEGHDGLVGINYLNKIQTPLLASLYGAMLAGVNIIMVGAGIPLEIPGVLSRFTAGEAAEVKLHVHEAKNGTRHKLSFDPGEHFGASPPAAPRPHFFPIVSSATLAALIIKRSKGKVDGLIIEGPRAGGHNAPPRGTTELSAEGEPTYGPRDAVDLDAVKALGLPFWLAGSYGSAARLREAQAAGAVGVQVGTLFAFCEDSDLCPELKRQVIARLRQEPVRVFTDPVASPAGFPFKVLSLPGTLSEADVYSERPRLCDLGYLRTAHEQPDGTLRWSCPAEDPETYVRKGGTLEDTVGRKCICNALMANIGMAQVRPGNVPELPLLTCGSDLSGVLEILGPDRDSYTAADVIDFLLAT